MKNIYEFGTKFKFLSLGSTWHDHVAVGLFSLLKGFFLKHYIHKHGNALRRFKENFLLFTEVFKYFTFILI